MRRGLSAATHNRAEVLGLYIHQPDHPKIVQWSVGQMTWRVNSRPDRRLSGVDR